jgi:hypothetical protein
VTEFDHLGSREGHTAAAHVERPGADLPPDLVFALDEEAGIERCGHRDRGSDRRAKSTPQRSDERIPKAQPA